MPDMISDPRNIANPDFTKRPRLIRPLLSAMLFASISLPAAEMQSNRGEAAMADRAKSILERYDKNGDGRIDEHERAEAHEGMRRERRNRQARGALAPQAAVFEKKALEIFDANGDGRLDEQERAEIRGLMEMQARGDTAALRAKALEFFDRDGNGRLDEQERSMMKEFGEAMRQTHGAAKEGREELIRRFDADGDGRIDEAERATMLATLRRELPANAQFRERFDRDGDGTLDDTEWAAARRELERRMKSGATGKPEPKQ